MILYYTIESLLTEIIEKTILYLAIDDRGAFSEVRGDSPGLMIRQADPVLYLSKTFKYTCSLFTAVGNEGCIISGLIAQEFMLPSSIRDNSD
jgi:hypothetical protein